MYQDDLEIKKKVRSDGWSNLFTGLGTRADKSKHAFNSINSIISDKELESIYISDGLGAKIVDLIPEDMVRHGWSYNFEKQKQDNENLTNTYNKELEKINFSHKVSQALKWARLYGGSIMIINTRDGQDLSQPLNLKSFRKVPSIIENLKIMPRTSIDFHQMKFQANPKKERFGEVELYPVKFKIGNGDKKTVFIHHSRVIEFKGVEMPLAGDSIIPREYRYWGIPVLQRVKDRLADLGCAFGSLSNLLQEITVGKYKFSNLADIMSQTDGGKLIQNRVQTMDLMKSTFHSIILDSEDDYVRDTLSLGGASDVLYQFFTIISASTGYPIMKLFGTSPKGMNSTGDGDVYSYYDLVRGQQELLLRPAIDRIIYIIGTWLNLEIPLIEFNALEQMTDKEKAELNEKKANTEKIESETYQAYIDMGIMEPDIVEELKFGDSLKKLKNKSNLPPVEEG